MPVTMYPSPSRSTGTETKGSSASGMSKHRVLRRWLGPEVRWHSLNEIYAADELRAHTAAYISPKICHFDSLSCSDFRFEPAPKYPNAPNLARQKLRVSHAAATTCVKTIQVVALVRNKKE